MITFINRAIFEDKFLNELKAFTLSLSFYLCHKVVRTVAQVQLALQRINLLSFYLGVGLVGVCRHLLLVTNNILGGGRVGSVLS